MRKLVYVSVLMLYVLIVGGIYNTIDMKAAGVRVEEKKFPDSCFREYIAEHIDRNRDGELSEAEIWKVKKMVFEWEGISNKNILDYHGIDIFTGTTGA